MLCYFCHMGFVLLWIVFLLVAIKLSQFDIEESKKLFKYSVLLMLFVLVSGVKIMLMNPIVSKSGMWLHIKLSFVILIMVENVYFYLKTKILKYWVFYLNLFVFLVMLGLTILKPF